MFRFCWHKKKGLLCHVIMPSENSTWGATGITGLVLHNPSGTYYHRYSIKGRRTYRSLRTKRFSSAKIKLAEANRDVEKTRSDAGGNTDGWRTLGDLEKVFFARLEESHEQGEATKDAYRVRAERIEIGWPEFRKVQIARVTREDILTFRGRLVELGYMPQSINLALVTLRLWLDIAVSEGVIHRNPFSNKGLKVFSKIFLPVEAKKVSLPSRADMEKVFVAIGTAARVDAELQPLRDAQGDDAEEAARLMAYSGARHMEAFAATWEDVDENRMRIRGTKSESSLRTIPLIPPMRALLEQMRERRKAANLPLTGKILRGREIGRRLRLACVKLGLPHLRQHDLRHYFATTCIESGVDIPTVSRWLGHADGGALAMRTYGHLRDEHSQSAAQKVTFSIAS